MHTISRMSSSEQFLATTSAGSVLTLTISSPTINSDDALLLLADFRKLIDTMPPEIKTVHLEISEVLGMSSRGFEALLVLHQGCTARGIEISVSKLTPLFHKLLARMGFLRLLKIPE